jgi:NADP-dependent 3-hydroxy acid dehydrogenase YdfG
VESFLKKGCKVAVSGRSEQAVNDVVQQLGSLYGADNVTGKACDVTSEENLIALWQQAKDSFGRVDIWVNNAGITLDRKPIWQQSSEEIQQIVATNLTGLMIANKIAIAGMLDQGGGQIWNMEGFGSNGQTQDGMVAYGATKRAVNYLNKALIADTKDTPVQIGTLSPGMVVTDLLVGEYDRESEEWKKVKKIFNILGDTVETVTPWLVNGMLAADKTGAKVIWLTSQKAFLRFMTAAFNKRDLFDEVPGA